MLWLHPANSGRKRNTRMTEELKGMICSLEERLLRPEVRKDPEELSRLIAEDFIEYGVSGKTYGKRELLQILPGSPAAETDMEECHARPLSPQVVLLSYKLLSRVDGESSPVRSERSSIWRLTDGRWQIVFHKGTRI